MSINTMDYANQASGMYDIFGVNGTSAVDAVSRHSSGGSSPKAGTSSGDTVSISAEARELFSRKTQMLHMEDEQTEQVLNLGAGNSGSTAATSTSEKKAAVDNGLSDEDREAAGVSTGSGGSGESGSSGSAGSVAASGGSSGGGSSAGSESGSEEENRQKELESELQSLQSQLLGILSGGGDPETNQVKAGPIEGKIRAVEGELQALKAQALKSAKG